MKKLHAAMALTALALTMTGCSSDPSAMDIANKVAEKREGAQVTEITSENDPNGLVGKTNGPAEAAHVAWQECSTELAVECGATVEVFEDDDAAQKRAEYIQGILAEAPMFGSEWDFVKDGTVLRLNGDLTEEEADELNVIDGELVKP